MSEHVFRCPDHNVSIEVSGITDFGMDVLMVSCPECDEPMVNTPLESPMEDFEE